MYRRLGQESRRTPSPVLLRRADQTLDVARLGILSPQGASGTTSLRIRTTWDKQ